jgi:hypothetical protein
MTWHLHVIELGAVGRESPADVLDDVGVAVSVLQAEVSTSHLRFYELLGGEGELAFFHCNE